MDDCEWKCSSWCFFFLYQQKQWGINWLKYTCTWLTAESNIIAYYSSPEGILKMEVTMPDTITTWVMQAVAINNKTGLGLATPLSIVVKRDFFISLNMPYSVKRGEQVSLLATVFNYNTMEIRVSLKNTFQASWMKKTVIGLSYRQICGIVSVSQIRCLTNSVLATGKSQYVALPRPVIVNNLNIISQLKKSFLGWDCC